MLGSSGGLRRQRSSQGTKQMEAFGCWWQITSIGGIILVRPLHNYSETHMYVEINLKTKERLINIMKIRASPLQ